MTRCSTGRATQKYSSSGGGADLSSVLTAHGDILYADSNTDAANVSIGSTTGHVLTITSPGELGWQAASVSGGNVGTLQAVTDNNSTTDNTVQFLNTTTALTTTGRVGIGTTTPDANLHVNGNAFVSSNLALGGVLSMGTVNVVARHTLSAITATGNLTPHTVIFDHPTTAFVTTGGNVGIGTSTPGYDLDVLGDINFTGALTQNGTTYGGGGSGSSPWTYTTGSSTQQLVFDDQAPSTTFTGTLSGNVNNTAIRDTTNGYIRLTQAGTNRMGSVYWQTTLTNNWEATFEIYILPINYGGADDMRFVFYATNPITTNAGATGTNGHGGAYMRWEYYNGDYVELYDHTATMLRQASASLQMSGWMPVTVTFNNGVLTSVIRNSSGTTLNTTTYDFGTTYAALYNTPTYVAITGQSGGVQAEDRVRNITINATNVPTSNTSNTVTRMNANVGIGTTTPGYDLDVLGDINFSGNVRRRGIVQPLSGSDVSYSTVENAVSTWTGRTIDANDWRNVTWSPELSLFVAVASSGTYRVATSPDGITWTGRTIDADFWYGITWSPELSLFVAVAGSGTNRVATSNLGIPTPLNTPMAHPGQLVVDTPTGNVGIGTTSPGYTLDVLGDINFTGALTQNGTTYGGGGSGSSQWVTSGNNIHYPTGDVTIGGVAGVVNQNYNSLVNIPASSRASGQWRTYTFGNITLPATWSNTNFQFKATVNGTLDGIPTGEYVSITMKKQGTGTQPSAALNFNPQNQSSGITSGGGKVYYTNVVQTNTTIANGSFSAGDVVDIYMTIYVTYWDSLSIAVEIDYGVAAFFVADSTNSRVGIGTTTPDTTLHIINPSTTTGARQFGLHIGGKGADIVPIINASAGGLTVNTVAGLEITSVDTNISAHGRHALIESVSAGSTYNTDIEFLARSGVGYMYSGGTQPATKQARIAHNGYIYARVGTSATGADYAELFEWDDGNPENEDRTGMTVKLMEGGKICITDANTSPNAVIGVISAIYGFLGNNHWDEWVGKYLKDSLGRVVTETVDMVTWRDEDDKEHTFTINTIPDDIEVPETATYYQDTDVPKLNPKYDKTLKYTERGKRKEWGAVGLVGRLRVLKTYPKSSRWIKLQDIDSEVEEYLAV